jgi:predicted dehydrogenase
LGLTHNYSGYPLVRQARAMATGGEIGEIIAVRVEYLQGWKQQQLKDAPKRGAWKSSPKLAGPAGTMADVGTHAFHLARYVTCFYPQRLICHMRKFCDEPLDDYGLVTLSSGGGPLMSLCVSQVSHGRLNDLRIDVDGTKGALSWRQEEPNTLIVRRQGQPLQVYERHPTADHMHDAERSACRIPPGHPEAFYEAFGNIYCGVYDDIVSLADGRPLQRNYPTVDDGVEGVKIIERCVQSSAADAEWVAF